MSTRILMIGLFFLISLQFSAFGQKTGYYHDLNLDYFPRIGSVKYDSLSLISVRVGGEFIETLEIISNKIIGKRTSFKGLSGLSMMAGMYPSQIKEAEKWMMVEIDKVGRINTIEIYESAGQLNTALSEQFMRILETAKINPAIQGGEPVTIRLYYTFETI